MRGEGDGFEIHKHEQIPLKYVIPPLCAFCCHGVASYLTHVLLTCSGAMRQSLTLPPNI